jgi:type I restriction enzyme S subunit
MNRAWQQVALGEVLRKSEESVLIDPNATYREVTIKLWGKGVVLRREASGSEIAAPRRSVVRAGQFILSRIDARNGAFGIVPPALDGAVVSNDFPSFNLDTQRIIPEYLGWLSRSADFVELCKNSSEGTTNRVRLKEEKFLSTTITLPSLAEQKRILARIEEFAAKIEEARGLRRLALAEAEALVTSIHNQLAGSRIRKIGEILRLEEDAVPIMPSEAYVQVGVRSFGGGLFPKPAVCGMDTTYRAFNRLYEGALVMSQVKAWEGAVAVCGKDLAGMYVSPEYRTFRFDGKEAEAEYFAALVKTEWFWSRLKDATRGVGARRERTRPEQFLNIEISVPVLSKQQEAKSIFSKIEAINRLQADTVTELDAMVPSILDRVFNAKI